MKRPEERKEFLQKLRIAASEADDLLTSCDASDLLDGLEVSRDFMFEASALIEQLESSLAQAERERDSMMPVFIREMKKYGCSTCEHYIPAVYTQECLGCGNAKLLHWKWNGICPENTKEE